MSNSKLNFYVIKGIKEESMIGQVLSRPCSPVQLAAGPVVMGTEALIPHSFSALPYPPPFLASSPCESVSCLQPPHPSHYFISSPTDAILYTSTTSALQPQILSINDKVRLGVYGC